MRQILGKESRLESSEGGQALKLIAEISKLSGQVHDSFEEMQHKGLDMQHKGLEGQSCASSATSSSQSSILLQSVTESCFLYMSHVSYT